ncbi:hypothetical protein SAMN05216439_1299 [Methanobrevibacter gottschalkii]|uniref:DUF3899 domain-containing protein n=1 Tax=Methanobrevibacter gottschalkii TaxID=190974 RepID=A0A1H7IZA2_9EURY|nr:hypothetical protein [Methanobrevibacter gottschalkii]SEK67524.1 hypothetical protein SAMN05216439_1299 [Methanobrevibacter gottschalkii]
MILNKYLSMILSACFFMLLMMIVSAVTVVFFNGGSIPYVGIVFVVIFYFMARMFYNYLRNDELYKNNKKHTSDAPDEEYMIKGPRDAKKIFIIFWVIIVLILAAVSLWLYSFNMGSV